MVRDLTSGAVTASEAGQGYSLTFLAEADFPSGFTRLNMGGGNITFEGNLFFGVGSLGGISAVEETVEMKSQLLDISLTGIDPSFLATALGEEYRGRTFKAWVAFFDPAGDLVQDPTLIIRGRMEFMTITLGEVGTIVLRVENILADWDRKTAIRFTNQAQQERFPGDRGFEYVPQMRQLILDWGVDTDTGSGPVTTDLTLSQGL